MNAAQGETLLDAVDAVDAVDASSEELPPLAASINAAVDEADGIVDPSLDPRMSALNLAAEGSPPSDENVRRTHEQLAVAELSSRVGEDGHASTLDPATLAEFSKAPVRFIYTIKPGSPGILQNVEERVSCVDLRNDGLKIAVAGGRRRDFLGLNIMNLWDVVTGEQDTLEGNIAWVNSAQFSPDGQFIVTANEDGTLGRWKANDINASITDRGYHLLPPALDHAGLAMRFREVGFMMESAHFSPDGQWIVAVASDETIRLLNVTTKEVSQRQHVPEAVSAQFSPDGRRIVVLHHNPRRQGPGQRDVSLWDWTDMQWLEVNRMEEMAGSAKFSPDGKWIVVGTQEGRARFAAIRELEEGSLKWYPNMARPDRGWSPTQPPQHVIENAHSGGVDSIDFSIDGSMIVSGGGDNLVRIWNATSRDPLITLEGHTGAVRSVAFGPIWSSLRMVPKVSGDTPMVISASDDGTLRVWKF